MPLHFSPDDIRTYGQAAMALSLANYPEVYTRNDAMMAAQDEKFKGILELIKDLLKKVDPELHPKLIAYALELNNDTPLHNAVRDDDRAMTAQLLAAKFSATPLAKYIPGQKVAEVDGPESEQTYWSSSPDDWDPQSRASFADSRYGRSTSVRGSHS